MCGDGFVFQGVEECDDGDDDNTDYCLVGCSLATCGDNIVQVGAEDCDDGNEDDGDECLTGCRLPHCGDGYLRRGVEECDDGNVLDTDDCVRGCLSARCGDGFVHSESEECDDANDARDDACLPGCIAARCGDNVVQTGVEDCDDGNLIDGDGCESDCTVCTTLSFDGVDDVVSIGRPDDFFYFGDISLDAWVRWDGPEAGRTWSVVVGHGTNNPVFRLQVNHDDGRVYFDTGADGRGPNAVLPAGRWVHVAAVSDGAARPAVLEWGAGR